MDTVVIMCVIGIIMCLAYLLGYLTIEIPLKRTASAQDGKFSMSRIAQLERESMAYWEQRFIAAGGQPEKKAVIEPEFVSAIPKFDHYLTQLENSYRTYIERGGDPRALPLEVREYMFKKDLYDYNQKFGKAGSKYLGVSDPTGRKYEGPVPTEYTRYSAH